MAQAAAKQAAATQVTYEDDELTSTTTRSRGRGRGRGRGTRGRGRGGVSTATSSKNSTTTTATTRIPRTQSKIALPTTQSRYQSVTRTRKTNRGDSR